MPRPSYPTYEEPAIMDTNLLCLIVPIILFVIFGSMITGGVLLLYFMNRSKTQNTWSEFAGKNGLSYMPPGFLETGYGTVTGSYQGRAVSFFTRSNNRVTWTYISFKVNNPQGIVLYLAAKGVEGDIAKTLLGTQDISIGIPDFDRKFIIQSNPVDLASRVLIGNAELRAEIMAIAPWELQFKDQYATCRILGPKQEIATLEKLFRFTNNFAEAIEKS